MASIQADRVLETTTTTGTGTLTLGGAVTGFRAFSSVMSNADTCYYSLQAVNGSGVPSGVWEVGIGTYASSGNTLARTTVLASSNSGAAVTLPTGTAQVCIDLPAEIIAGQPNMSVGLASGQSITAGTFVKVLYDTVTYDPSGAWDATNKRWVPKKVGKYRVSVTVNLTATSTSSIDAVIAAIYKNGTLYRDVVNVTAVLGSGVLYAACVSADIAMNGSTDYIEGWGYLGGAVSPVFRGGVTFNAMDISFIGP